MIWRRRRLKRRRSGVFLRKLYLAAVFCLLLALVLGSLRNLEKLISVYGESRCRNLLSQTVLEAVSQVRSDEKPTSFTETDGEGVLRLNSSAVHQYQTSLGLALAEKLEELQQQSHQVALGTVLDSRLLMGRGPAITIRFIPAGSALTDIRSSLRSAGINQVLYNVSLELSVTVTILMPGGPKKVEHTQQVILEETLLSGQVPYVYGA